MKYFLALIFWLSAALAVALAVTKPAQAAPTIGFFAKGPWGVCVDAPKAYNIADVYQSAGKQASNDVFKQYIDSGHCFILGSDVEFFIQAVVHRRGDARVVRVADREGNLWYWLTTLAITGEPMPLDKDV